MSGLVYKIGVRLSRIGFIRSAIRDKADLSGFDHKFTFRIVFGVFLIIFSFLIGWPAISTLGGLAIYFRKPWIAVIGAPVLWVLSHICCTAGMALSGAKYARLFMRWSLRIWVERLLSYGGIERKNLVLEQLRKVQQ